MPCTRRTGKEALHTRIVPSAAMKDSDSRSARKAELMKETDFSTHWEGCWKSHWRCAELKLIDEIDIGDDDLTLADEDESC